MYPNQHLRQTNRNVKIATCCFSLCLKSVATALSGRCSHLAQILVLVSVQTMETALLILSTTTPEAWHNACLCLSHNPKFPKMMECCFKICPCVSVWWVFSHIALQTGSSLQADVSLPTESYQEPFPQPVNKTVKWLLFHDCRLFSTKSCHF